MTHSNPARATGVELAQLLFVGTHGRVRAVEKRTGRQVWDTRLPKGGLQLVTLLCEDGVVFAGAYGRLHALDGLTGRLLWSNELPGLGYSFMTLATARAASDGIQYAAASAAAAAQVATH